MNKYAREVLRIKTAQTLQDPRVPQEVKELALDFAKHAGLFGTAMEGIGNLGSNLLDSGSSLLGSAASGIGSTFGNLGSSLGNLGSNIMSGIGSMLPPGVTWQRVADSLKQSDPEIARMSSNPHFMEALKQAVSESGQPINVVLEALGIR